MDYVADRFRTSRSGRRDGKARALARTISAEMHSGFRGLRAACPMNLAQELRRPRSRRSREQGRRAHRSDSGRRRRASFGAKAGGPFLFGAFTAAERCSRRSWRASRPIRSRGADRAYMDAVLDRPAFKEWRRAALEETGSSPTTRSTSPPIGPFR